jgi:hypothetical protein
LNSGETNKEGRTMHELVVSPFLGDYFVLRPGRRNAVKISPGRYAELQSAGPDEPCPGWLADAARHAWGIDISGRVLRDLAIVREPSPLGYGRASYELNMGCNYDCKHCYLGLKEFAGLDWPARERILSAIHDAGVLWLQLTGGEPTIDRLGVDPETRKGRQPGGASHLPAPEMVSDR